MQPDQRPYAVRFARRQRLCRVVHPSKDPNDPVLDAYRNPVTKTRLRLRGCRCAVPCEAFTCGSSHHRGPRATPWCRGGDDYADMAVLVGVDVALITTYLDGDKPVERCDDCWSKHQGLQRAVTGENQETADAA